MADMGHCALRHLSLYCLVLVSQARLTCRHRRRCLAHLRRWPQRRAQDLLVACPCWLV